MVYIGIDIGSTNSKLAILGDDKTIIKFLSIKTGCNSNLSSEKLLSIASEFCDINDAKITATGYGRVSVNKADKIVTEITCHAKGAIKLFSQNDLVVIDIGGQDTKVINIENGMVCDFVMNDKCSAGTGRFLEVMARDMECDVPTLVNMARNGSGVSISSLCTVFAESEVISLIGKSEKKENIANAIVVSIVDKVVSQMSKMNYIGKQVCLTGGLCEMKLIIDMLSDKLGTVVISDKNAKFAGAIGAAILGIGQ